MDSYVADTMSVILWIEKRKMPEAVKNIFKAAERGNAKIYVPAMVLAEIGYLAEKKKIDITLADAILYLEKNQLRFAPQMQLQCRQPLK